MGIKTLISGNLKKTLAAILAGIMLLSVTACNKPDETTSETTSVTTTESTGTGYTFAFTDEPEENSSEYIVDNEEQAQKIINCSHRNLFGLEKMVLSEDRLVAVFDKDTCDNAGCFIGQGNEAIEYIWFSYNNLSSIQPEFDVTQDKDKYILDASCHYEQSDLIDPTREVKITALYVKGKYESINIDICANDLEISFYEENYDSHKMYYDASEKTWSDVTTKIYRQDDSGTDGIDISYDLDLVFGQEQTVYDYDGVTYQLSSYGRYVTVQIENKGTEAKTIGGSRYLQRVNGDDLIDLGRNGRETTLYEGVVKDLPVAKISVQSGTDPKQPSQRDSSAYTLYENDTFEIEPGESLLVEIMVIDFDVYKDGIYRLTFGDAQIDFELEWKMIW